MMSPSVRGHYVYIAHWFPRGIVPPFQG